MVRTKFYPILIIICSLLVGLSSCSKDEQAYPSYVMSFAQVTTDIQGRVSQIDVDNGASYRVLGNYMLGLQDTVLRAYVVYVPHTSSDETAASSREANTSSDETAAFSREVNTSSDETAAFSREANTSSQPLLTATLSLCRPIHVATISSFYFTYEDCQPMRLRSVWVSGGYLNFDLSLLAGPQSSIHRIEVGTYQPYSSTTSPRTLELGIRTDTCFSDQYLTQRLLMSYAFDLQTFSLTPKDSIALNYRDLQLRKQRYVFALQPYYRQQ